MSDVVETTVSGATAPYNWTTTAQPNDVTVVDHTVGTITGGAGASTIHGAGSEQLTFIGGSGAATVYGGANATMWGGTGTAPNMFVGGVNADEVAGGSGPTTLIAGTGNSTLEGAFGAGPETFYTNPNGSTHTLISLNNNADSVYGGSGASSVYAGTGDNVFGFIKGTAGGTETIYNLANDPKFTLTFGGYGTTPIANENVVGGSDVINLTDGTTITLDGIGHKIFNGIGTE